MLRLEMDSGEGSFGVDADFQSRERRDLHPQARDQGKTSI